MILRGELRPGERLNELALSRQLGISRPALREAIRGLEQAALVEVVPNRGTIVRRASVKDALDFYELRAALFRAGAELAARRATPEALARLHAAQQALEAAFAAGDADAYYARNLDFHARLMAASGNRPLADAYDNTVKRLHLFRRLSLQLPAQLDRSLREHAEILAALEAHDAAAAGAAAERHVGAGRDRMLDRLEPEDLPARTKP